MKLPNALSVIAAVSLFSGTLQAGLIDEVPPGSLKELAANQVVVQSTKVAGAPWPQLSLYQVVQASPKVMTALLNDYAAAPSYTPNMVAVKLLSTNPDGSKDLEYTTRVPILGKINYTVRNTYTKSGNMYTVAWTLLKSPFAKKSDGSIRIEPYGTGQTLMCYTNLVIPITTMVPGIQGQALSEAKATVAAIEREGEKRAGVSGN
jgi:hypothetical protein